ncbi:hypothetical protein CHISP_1524 [Chitinispirillum alkaliphilum]|nr:hypothetical protein CHISP_1524 [Chitinispirillum alkaliphilum]
MIRLSKILLLAASALFLYSCGGSGQFLVQKSSLSQTSLLKQECVQRNIVGEEIRVADSLFSEAQKLMARKRHEEAFLISEMAGARYRLALAKLYKEESNKTYHQAWDRKKSAEEKVQTYRQKLEEMRASRGP